MECVMVSFENINILYDIICHIPLYLYKTKKLFQQVFIIDVLCLQIWCDAQKKKNNMI